MSGASIYIIAWPPHLLGWVVFHSSQQQSPVPCPLHEKYWFLSVGFPPPPPHPASRDRFLDPKSLDLLPWPWKKRGILKQLPGRRWQHLFCWCESQQFLPRLNWDYPGCCQPCGRALRGSHEQFSNCGLVTDARQTLESQYHPISSVTQTFTCKEMPPLLPNSASFELPFHWNFSLVFF